MGASASMTSFVVILLLMCFTSCGGGSTVLVRSSQQRTWTSQSFLFLPDVFPASTVLATDVAAGDMLDKVLFKAMTPSRTKT